jgi:hypothetical protein
MRRENDTRVVLDVNARQLAISCQTNTSKPTKATDLDEVKVRRVELHEMKEKIDIKKKWNVQVFEGDE